MSRTCRLIVIVFATLYSAAFALFLIGTNGWFGSPKGPVHGPWLFPVDSLDDDSISPCTPSA